MTIARRTDQHAVGRAAGKVRANGERVRLVHGLLATGLAIMAADAAFAGPVLVYRYGDFCPHDRDPAGPRITAEQAIERAKKLLPKGFCGPDWWVDGCVYDPEWAFDTWRVFSQQYKLIDGREEIQGRDHTYVILDAVGNCIANIPGT